VANLRTVATLRHSPPDFRIAAAQVSASIVSLSAPDLVAENAILRVSDDYLAEAIETLQGLFAAVALEAIDKYSLPTADGVTSGVVDYAYRLLLEGRERLALQLFEWSARQHVDDTPIVTRAQVNRWLLLKRGGRFHEVESEVRAWDAGGLGPLYQMAKHALLDERAAAMTLARGMFLRREITPSELFSQPLFAPIRGGD
jgi:hypothetical protein